MVQLRFVLHLCSHQTQGHHKRGFPRCLQEAAHHGIDYLP